MDGLKIERCGVLRPIRKRWAWPEQEVVRIEREVDEVRRGQVTKPNTSGNRLWGEQFFARGGPCRSVAATGAGPFYKPLATAVHVR